MGRTFSVDLDDKTMNSLEEIMVKWPKKSRNGVIRHIINTYSADNSDLLWRIEHQGHLMDELRRRLDTLDKNWNQI